MNIEDLFKIHSNTLEPKQGDILISEPLMNDFYFGRSVVLLVDHNDAEGTFGIVLNNPTNAMVSQVVEEFPDFDAPVFIGGPVAEDQLFFIHTLGDLLPDACKIIDGLYWGGDADTLKTLISTGIANPENVRFFLGYSGWDSGQLVSELTRNSWLVHHITADRAFNTAPERMWQECVDDMGNDYASWKRFPHNAEDN